MTERREQTPATLPAPSAIQREALKNSSTGPSETVHRIGGEISRQTLDKAGAKR